MRIPSVGRSTADELVRNRTAMMSALGDDGSLDWEAYCAGIKIPLIPTNRPTSGAAFLARLPQFFDELALSLNNAVKVSILQERICQPPQSQKTLEQISQALVPPVSRERIRQIEAKLLDQITGGLLNDGYNGLDIHFHPDFSRWWKSAADALSGREEIKVADFVELLGNVWDVPAESIMAQLPAIVAIATGEPQMANSFRQAAKANPKLFGALPEELAGLSVLKLRIGKSALRLYEAGVGNVGQIVAHLRSGTLDFVGQSVAREAKEHLNVLAHCVGERGEIDWLRYSEQLNLPMLPDQQTETASAFVSGLRQEVGALLGAQYVTKRAVEIFRLRTSQDADDRMTLQQVADTLSTHLPTVKREETYLLEWLYDALMEREFWMTKVWLDERWLEFWNDAQTVFEQSAEDFQRFSENLAWRWRLQNRQIKQATPILWAVLTGYPDGRPSKYVPPVVTLNPDEQMVRIRLKGFRRMH